MLYLGVAARDLEAKNLRGLYFHPQCERVTPHAAAANETLQREFWDFTVALTRRDLSI